MWFATKPNGVYAQERVTDPLTGKVRIVSVKCEKDTKAARKQAEKDLLAKITAIQEEQPGADLKLAKLLDIYEEKVQVSARTLRKLESRDKTLLDVLGDVYISRLTKPIIIDKFDGTGKDAGWKNGLLNHFKAVIHWGYQQGRIPSGELANIPRFKDRNDTPATDEHEKYLEKEELERLLESMADNPVYQETTRFLSLSGVRIGEFAALDNADIDGDYIRIRKTWDFNGYCLTDPKTADSIRDVFIQPELGKSIKRLQTLMKERRLKFGLEDQGYLFTSIHGARMGGETYAKYLAKKSKQVLGFTISPHWLRHTMTSLFAEAGVPLETISRRLGHADSTITRQIYLHTTEKVRAKDDAIVKEVAILS